MKHFIFSKLFIRCGIEIGDAGSNNFNVNLTRQKQNQTHVSDTVVKDEPKFDIYWYVLDESAKNQILNAVVDSLLKILSSGKSSDDIENDIKNINYDEVYRQVSSLSTWMSKRVVSSSFIAYLINRFLDFIVNKVKEKKEKENNQKNNDKKENNQKNNDKKEKSILNPYYNLYM